MGGGAVPRLAWRRSRHVSASSRRWRGASADPAPVPAPAGVSRGSGLERLPDSANCHLKVIGKAGLGGALRFLGMAVLLKLRLHPARRRGNGRAQRAVHHFLECRAATIS